ncbi:MAG: pyridoxamine 5'-phosphate oxidase family protein [Eggerthellaceae bacterium]|nr:pyridoxamine 5'-phosphate oxidase family protein [Eggerthellaceae bacterium]MCH4221340.1 pyridoxamine 5'-phosphate oxidase family protein [Eggerthellaceae bacterium]
MFRKMRRSKQQLNDAESQAILSDPKNTHGVLAVNGDDGYPYAAPISFVWDDGSLWIHMALSGHRFDSLQEDSKVCFTVVDSDETDEAGYTAKFRSVVVFGHAYLVEDDEERCSALELFTSKYAQHRPKEERFEKAHSCTRSAIFRIEPEHITGKRSNH